MRLRVISLFLLAACTSSPSLTRATLHVGLTAENGDSFEPATLIVACRSGELRTFELDFSAADDFEVALPPCGQADFTLDIYRAPRSGETEHVIAFMTATTAIIAPGTNDLVLKLVKKGELQIDNGLAEACGGPAIVAPMSSTKRVLDPGNYTVTCGDRSETATVRFAERSVLRLEPVAPPDPDPVVPRGKAELHGPSRVYGGRRHVFDASFSLDATGAPTRALQWVRDDTEIGACRNQPICSFVVGESDPSFVLTVRGAGQVLDESMLAVTVEPPPPVSRRASLSWLGRTENDPPYSSGGDILIVANGAQSGNESLVTTEPPPAAQPFSRTGRSERCTIRVPSGGCGMNSAIVFGAAEPTLDGIGIDCSDGGMLSTDNANLSLVELIYEEDMSAFHCAKIDARAFAGKNVDFYLELGNNVAFDLYGPNGAPQLPGDGVYVWTLGNVWVNNVSNATFTLSANDGAHAGLPSVSDFPRFGAPSHAAISLLAGPGKTVQLDGGFNVDTTSAPGVGDYVVGTGPVDSLATDGSHDVVLNGPIVMNASGFGFARPTLLLMGRRVFLPALESVLAYGQPAGMYTSPGNGGIFEVRAEGATTATAVENIYLSGLADDSALVKLGGGAATQGLSSTSFTGGRAGQMRLQTGGGKSAIEVAAVIDVKAGDGELAGGNGPTIASIGAAFNTLAYCRGDCRVAVAMDIDARGGFAELRPVTSNADSGNGGDIYIGADHFGDDPTRRLSVSTAAISANAWQASGGGCLDDGFASPVTSAWTGGDGGRVFVDAKFGLPAATASVAALNLAANKLAHGGSCDARRGLLPGLDTAVALFEGGPGGHVDFKVEGHSRADVLVTSKQLDARGGDSFSAGGSSALTQRGGNGGAFSWHSVGAGASRVELAGTVIATHGGEAIADTPLDIRGGDAGGFELLDEGPQSTFVTDASSRLDQQGGDATASVAMTASGGAGGLLRVVMESGAPLWDQAFSACVYPTPGTAPSGGTATGGTTSTNGAAGQCLWVPFDPGPQMR